MSRCDGCNAPVLGAATLEEKLKHFATELLCIESGSELVRQRIETASAELQRALAHLRFEQREKTPQPGGSFGP